jgi:hypothetical protein
MLECIPFLIRKKGIRKIATQWRGWRNCRRSARREVREQPLSCEFYATTSGGKHETRHHYDANAATTGEDGAAAAQWAIARRECEKLSPFCVNALLPLYSLQSIFNTQETEIKWRTPLADISISPPQSSQQLNKTGEGYLAAALKW